MAIIGQGAVQVSELSVSSEHTFSWWSLPQGSYGHLIVLQRARLFPTATVAVAGMARLRPGVAAFYWGTGVNTELLLVLIYISLLAWPQPPQLLLLLERVHGSLSCLSLCPHLNLSFQSSLNLSFDQGRKFLEKFIIINSSLTAIRTY